MKIIENYFKKCIITKIQTKKFQKEIFKIITKNNKKKSTIFFSNDFLFSTKEVCLFSLFICYKI